jgi:iron(III) transport system ATP-binding protein
MNQSSQTQPAVSIDIEGVNLSYGSTHVLKDINLSIAAGEFFAFLGPSGCGKTTLLRLIAGFNVAQTGAVKLSGESITQLPPWQRDVGMVFQSYALWPHMSVAKNVAFGLEEMRLPADEIAVKVDAALDLVGLRALKDRKPSQLSGGQQQRVALARTIAVRPKVLLLDEPLSNLDAKMRVDVRRELRELQQRLGITTVFVTHDQEEANTIADRIALFDQGRVQQVGTPMALYDKPANLFAASFLGSANILDGTVVDNGFQLGNGTLIPVTHPHSPPNAKVMFRPQNVHFADAIAARPGHTLLDGSVIHSEFLGSMVRYVIRIGGNEVLVDIAHQAGNPPLTQGLDVKLELDHSRAMILGD